MVPPLGRSAVKAQVGPLIFPACMNLILWMKLACMTSRKLMMAEPLIQVLIIVHNIHGNQQGFGCLNVVVNFAYHGLRAAKARIDVPHLFKDLDLIDPLPIKLHSPFSQCYRITAKKRRAICVASELVKWP